MPELGGFLRRKTEHRNTARAHEHNTRSRTQHTLTNTEEAHEYNTRSQIQHTLTPTEEAHEYSRSSRQPAEAPNKEHWNTEKATQLAVRFRVTLLADGG